MGRKRLCSIGEREPDDASGLLDERIFPALSLLLGERQAEVLKLNYTNTLGPKSIAGSEGGKKT